MKASSRIALLLVVVVFNEGWAVALAAQPIPTGELIYAMHVTIAPAWFDPAENGGLITPFAVLYALHDGVVRPTPGAKIGNSLAESWTESPDGGAARRGAHDQLHPPASRPSAGGHSAQKPIRR